MKDDYSSKREYNLALIDNKFDSLEEKVRDLRMQVDDLSKINNVLIELKHLSQQQGEMIERLFTVQVEQSDTLIAISKTTNALDYRVSGTEEMMEDMSEEWCKEKEKSAIHLGEVVKSGVFLILGAAMAALIGLIMTQ